DAEAAGISELFAELVTLLVRHGLLLRPEFTLAFKAIGQGEAIMRTLMGDEQPGAIVDIAFRTIRQALVRELDPRRLGPDTLLPLTREALGRLPNLVSALTSLLDDFERGRTALQLDVSSVNRRVTDVQDSFERGFRRMVLSISLAGLLLGSSLLLLAPLGDIVSGNEEFVIRLVAGIGVTASGVMTISIVASMLLPLGREVARRERRSVGSCVRACVAGGSSAMVGGEAGPGAELGCAVAAGCEGRSGCHRPTDPTPRSADEGVGPEAPTGTRPPAPRSEGPAVGYRLWLGGQPRLIRRRWP